MMQGEREGRRLTQIMRQGERGKKINTGNEAGREREGD
jgi:hypothetical protein